MSAISNPTFVSQINELHFITPISHLPSILEHGIWSHNKVSHIRLDDVSNSEVQELREGKTVPRAIEDREALTVHDHAVLYFNAHNAMLHNIVHFQKKDVKDLCVLRVAKEILDYRHTIVSDQNAATRNVHFFKPNDFSPLPDHINALTSSYSMLRFIKKTEPAFLEYQQRRQAEVLIPYRVHVSYIKGAYIANEQALQSVIKIIDETSHLGLQDKECFKTNSLVANNLFFPITPVSKPWPINNFDRAHLKLEYDASTIDTLSPAQSPPASPKRQNSNVATFPGKDL